MSRKSSLAAGFLSSCLIITTLSAAANAQGIRVNRILACVENEANHTLTLRTAIAAPIAAPTIQYLPGNDGRTVMVADFYGLSWIEGSRVIRPVQTGVSSVEEVRIGQFQSNPPICRIALSSHDPACLKSVSFSSQTGSLVIKWGSDNKGTQTARKSGGDKVASASVPPSAPSYDGGQSSAPKPGNGFEPVKSGGDGVAIIRTWNRPSTAPHLLPAGSQAQQQGGEPPTPERVKAPAETLSAPPQAPPYAVQSQDQDQISGLLDAVHRSGKPGNHWTKRTKPSSAESPTGGQEISQSRTPEHPDEIRQQQNNFAAPAKPTVSSLSNPPSVAPAIAKTPQSIANSSKKALKNVSLPTSSQTAIDSESAPSMIKKTMPPPAPSLVAKTKPPRRAEVRDSISDDNEPYESTAEREQETADTAAPGPPMARLTIINGKNPTDPQATIQILTEKHITFKSFRLHNPERHVIDLEKPEELDEATVAAFETNPYLKTVRIGTPDKNTCRIVLDLADENVGVAERTYIGDDKLLTVTLSPAPQPATVAVSPQNGQQTIVLDAGHGGSDPGAQRGDIQEKEMTLAIVQQLQKRLEGQGFKVVMTRVDDTFVSLEDRVKLTNQIMPSAFVSVHINALESTSDIHGIETYFQTEQSRPLAEVIHGSLVNGLGVPDRGIRKARFYVINHTPVPAILAEVGFISNKEERDKLNSFDYQGKVADAISQGVMLYLGKSSITQKVPAHPALATDRKPAGKGTTGKTTKSVASSFPANTKPISR